MTHFIKCVTHVGGQKRSVSKIKIAAYESIPASIGTTTRPACGPNAASHGDIAPSLEPFHFALNVLLGKCCPLSAPDEFNPQVDEFLTPSDLNSAQSYQCL